MTRSTAEPVPEDLIHPNAPVTCALDFAASKRSRTSRAATCRRPWREHAPSPPTEWRRAVGGVGPRSRAAGPPWGRPTPSRSQYFRNFVATARPAIWWPTFRWPKTPPRVRLLSRSRPPRAAAPSERTRNLWWCERALDRGDAPGHERRRGWPPQTARQCRPRCGRGLAATASLSRPWTTRRRPRPPRRAPAPAARSSHVSS